MFRMLIGQLLYLNKQQETEIWRESGLVDLITDDKDKVLGVLAEKDGKKVRLGAKNGVLLASGGFAKNSSMRETFQKKGKHTSWSAASAGDTGDAITVGQKLGAAVELMDKAWWMPMIMVGETPIFDLSVRSFPHSTVVDGSGSRYLNESGCYNDFGEAMNKHHDTNAAAVPPWIILDQAHAYAFKKSGPTLLRGLPWRKRVAVNFKL
jgi:3-oxosteroid 1-dehydrogenase